MSFIKDWSVLGDFAKKINKNKTTKTTKQPGRLHTILQTIFVLSMVKISGKSEFIQYRVVREKNINNIGEHGSPCLRLISQ